MAELPHDVFVIVFYFLGARERLVVASLSREFRTPGRLRDVLDMRDRDTIYSRLTDEMRYIYTANTVPPSLLERVPNAVSLDAGAFPRSRIVRVHDNVGAHATVGSFPDSQVNIRGRITDQEFTALIDRVGNVHLRISMHEQLSPRQFIYLFDRCVNTPDSDLLLCTTHVSEYTSMMLENFTVLPGEVIDYEEPKQIMLQKLNSSVYDDGMIIFTSVGERVEGHRPNLVVGRRTLWRV